jgi:TRAP-type uncharacterized transport system fused permease subunit
MLKHFFMSTPIPVISGYVLAVFSLVVLYTMYYINRKQVLTDLRGKDLLWQFVELTAIVWLILLPVMVVCDLLGVHASAAVWTSMDAIYLINVGGKVTSKYFESRNGGKS